MKKLENILNELTSSAQLIFKEALVGVYLHGSAAMDCFNFEKSDIDLIIVVTDEIDASMKKAFMDKVVLLNNEAPQKGIELSVVKESVCKPFIYPTPFELHFSPMHLNWYKSNPDEYIDKMNGEDKDLAAHFTIINHRGECLAGLPIRDVFGPIPNEAYMDSIWEDICEAKNKIADNTMYLILNLSRVLAYKKEGTVLSKKEGGEWALEKLPTKYHLLISDALADYSGVTVPKYDLQAAIDYADYMLTEIKMASDCTVAIDNGFINMRVGAIIMKGDKFLMVGNQKDDYLYSVGGRIKFGESAEEAVVREVLEETGIRLEVDRLGFIHENFFYGDYGKAEEKLIYEISYFFFMKTPDDFEPICYSFTDDKSKERLVWVDEKSDIKYYPEFFRDELSKPVKTVKHIVTDNRK